jgi:hypothetical protein
MLSTMAHSLGFKKLQQIDIDKLYSPQAYANRAAAAQEIQNLARASFENINQFIMAQQHAAAPPQGNQPARNFPAMPPPGYPSRNSLESVAMSPW